MKKSGMTTEKALEYAIKSIGSDYVKAEEPEYDLPPIVQRNYCTVQSLDSFDVKKL